MKIENFKEQNNDYGLIFKNHSLFFDVLFEYIKDFENMFADSLIDNKMQVKAIIALNRIVNFTSAHLNKLTKLEDLNKQIEVIIELNKNKDFDTAKTNLDTLSALVFGYLEKMELLPKVQIDLSEDKADFWKAESDESLKNMKKGFYDFFELNND